jgi:hypothetical protein
VHAVVIHRAERAHCQAVQHDVLADGKARHQMPLLVHDGDAERAAVMGVADLRGDAVEQDLAGIRLVHAGDHLDQRRLSGAVLAEERMDRPAFQVDRHVLQRFHAWECLGHMTRFKRERACLGCHGRNLTRRLAAGRARHPSRAAG